MTVVAEGVETPEQNAILREQKCEEFQGYLFCRPTPAEDIEKLLSKASIPLNAPSTPPLVPVIESKPLPGVRADSSI
jgi:hypothetical protein